MSISAFREMVEKPGCRWFIAVVSLGFAVGMMGVTRGCGDQQQGESSTARSGPAIAKIGDFKIYENDVVDKARQASPPLTSTPATIAKNYAQTLDGDVTQGLLLALAKQYNVSFDDKSVMQNVESQWEDYVMQQKLMLAMQRKIPQNATDQQLDDYFKSHNQRPLADQKKAILDNIQTELNDPNQKTQILGQFANSLVEKGIEASINPSDQDLQHSQDDYNTKRIYFDTTKHPNEDVQKLAQSVLEEIKSGKLTFEQAMDKYTDDPPGAGKPKHENTNTLPKQTIDSDPSYAPLGQLKTGQMSDVIPVPPTGYAIYRLDSIKANVPPDFAKNKDSLRKSYVQLLAASKLQAGLKQLRSQNAISWSSPGWDVLYNWYETTTADNTFGTKPQAEQHKVQKDFVQQGMSSGTEWGMLAAAGAMDSLWTGASASDKKTLEPDYMKIISAVLQNEGSFPGCMQLVQMAADQKDSKALASALTQAAQLNMAGVTDPSGPTNFGDIQGLVEKYRANGMLTADQAKQIESDLDEYRSERLDYEQQMAKQRQEEAVEKAKAEADEKKQAEEAAKAAAAQKAAKPAPNATGATAPAPSTGLLNPAPTGNAIPAPAGAAKPAAAPSVGKPTATAPAKPATGK